MVTWPDLRLDRPKAARWAAPFGVTLALGALGGAGCALVGYGFDGYGGVGGSTGAGGSSTQGSGGRGGAATTGETTGTSSSTTTDPAGSTTSTTSTTSTSSGPPCTLPSDCDDQNICTTESCVMGACDITKLSVDDFNPCTDDFCDPAQGVYHLDTVCDDGDLCTIDSCDKNAAGCVHKTASIVDDGNACTTDSCDPGSGVPAHVPVAGCCPHSVCSAGAPLDPGACPMPDKAASCIKSVCVALPTCCSTSWSAACAAAVPAVCSINGALFSCACGHSLCVPGPALSPSCDPCVLLVCSNPATAHCCDANGNLGWNAACVAQTHNLCNFPLGAGCQ